MLERRNRMTSSAGFTAATRGGRRAGTRTLVTHLAVRPSEGGAPRVGFVVGRVVGGAVTRNRVRRRLRHLVRERLGQLPDSADLVVRALPPAAEVSYATLGRDLDQALGRLGVTERRHPEPAR